MRELSLRLTVLVFALAGGMVLSGVAGAGAAAVDTPAANSNESTATPASAGGLLGDTVESSTGAVGERVASVGGGDAQTAARETPSATDDPVSDRQATASEDTPDDSSGVVAGAVNETVGSTTTVVSEAVTGTTETVNATTETVNTTIDSTTGTVNATTGTVNTTIDSPSETVNATTETVNATVGSTTETVNATTETVNATVDSTTDTADGTVNATTETVNATVGIVTSATGVETGLTTVTERTTSTVGTTTTALLDGTDELTGAVTDADAVVAPPDPGRTDADGRAAVASAAPGGVTDSTTDGGLDADVADSAVPAPVDAGERAPAPTAPVNGLSAEEEATSRTASAGPGRQGEPGQPDVGSSALAGLGAVAVGAALTGGTGVEREVSRQVVGALERLFRTAVAFRYSQFDDSDPLEHEDRAAIHEYVTDNPGAYVAAVSAAVGVNHSTARHHVKMLEREGLVENAKVRGRRRLFPAHSEHQELAAAMADESTAALLEALARLGPCSGSALAAEVDRAVSTVSHHLSRLADDGLVVRERDGRTRRNHLPPDVRAALAPEREPAAPDATAVSAD